MENTRCKNRPAKLWGIQSKALLVGSKKKVTRKGERQEAKWLRQIKIRN